MSATPIPRTQLLAAYGDVTVSNLRHKPPGRKPVATRVLHADRMGELLDGVARQLEGDERIYWICPVIEGSEEGDDVAASSATPP
jgi:ATP-dependent DNA helicase RecG